MRNTRVHTNNGLDLTKQQEARYLNLRKKGGLGFASITCIIWLPNYKYVSSNTDGCADVSSLLQRGAVCIEPFTHMAKQHKNVAFQHARNVSNIFFD